MKKSGPTCRFQNRAIVGPKCDWALRVDTVVRIYSVIHRGIKGSTLPSLVPQVSHSQLLPW